jgi:glycine cleavage system H protein
MIPDDRVYTRNHEWVKVGKGILELGVTQPLLRKIGPLISVELPDADDELKAELPFGELEGLEETWQLYPPVEGRILEVNDEIVWDHKKLVKDPYGKGWLLKVRPHDPEAVKRLWAPGLYRKYCEDTLKVGRVR